MSATNELLRTGQRAQRRSSLVWTLALTLLALSVVAVWPSMESSGALESITSGLSPELAGAFGLDGFATASGYLRGNLYALLYPVLLAIMGVTAVAATIAGDEEAGKLELLLALPVRRRSVFLTRFVAVIISLTLASVVVAVVMIGSVVALDMDVTASGLSAVSINVWLLAVFHAALAYLVACLGLGRAVVMGVAGGVLMLGYVVYAIAPLSQALEPIAVVSPWDWALGGDPLENGLSFAGTVTLIVVSAVLAATGTALVERRDVKTA